MYSRSIESLMELRAKGKEEDRQYRVREHAKKLFATGAYLAQYPHRNYDKSVAAFQSSIETITTLIPSDKLRNDDYLFVMQCYERLVTFAVCNRTPAAVAEMKTQPDAASKAAAKIKAHAATQAEASMWLRKALEFNRSTSAYSYPGMKYYLTLLSACYNCANGKYESSILIDQPISPADRHEIENIAAEMRAIIQTLTDNPYRPPLKTEQLRELAACQSNIGSLYRIISSSKNALKHSTNAIQLLDSIPDNEKISHDFLSISCAYSTLASAFHKDKMFSELFSQARNFFAGDAINFFEFRKIILRNSLVIEKDDARRELLIRLLTMMEHYAKHNALPASELKTQLQNDVIHRFFMEDLQRLSRDKTNLADVSIFAQQPQTARAHTQTEYIREHIIPESLTPPMLRKKTF